MMQKQGYRTLNSQCGGRQQIGGAKAAELPHGEECAAGYSLPATLLNVAVRLVPTAVKAPIAATAIRAAIRPYSMAVAPFSSFRSRTMEA